MLFIINESQLFLSNQIFTEHCGDNVNGCSTLYGMDTIDCAQDTFFRLLFDFDATVDIVSHSHSKSERTQKT
ncbi:hypothetical protein C7H79_05400 [Nitrosomonas supralitoralis]|uniref:Uncharacterized protein n=1 Tax=Nitrosomonas supralitoralis TaxID=2116706 RepID=A0A2P7NX02_9PROT|nr:hypothetical protein C7H79_05400 [Nitrosomonas supralitoralis]